MKQLSLTTYQQSMFGFFGRVAGTTLSMIASIVIWYIVDQKTPGIIVMLWVFIFLEMYCGMAGYYCHSSFDYRIRTSSPENWYCSCISEWTAVLPDLRARSLPPGLCGGRVICGVCLDGVPLPTLRPQLASKRPRIDALLTCKLLQCRAFHYRGKNA
jgi:hypothetical protein